MTKGGRSSDPKGAAARHAAGATARNEQTRPAGTATRPWKWTPCGPVLSDQDPPRALFDCSRISPTPWKHSLGDDGIEACQPLMGISRSSIPDRHAGEAGMERRGKPGDCQGDAYRSCASCR